MCNCKSCTNHVDLKEIKLKEIINRYKDQKGSLITVLQEAQEIYGYLPQEVLKTVAEQMKIPTAEVHGVSTFYSQFRFSPMGRNVIRVCMGTACHVRGALKVLKTLEKELGIKAGCTTGDGKFTLETVACIGACGLAPVISVNNKVYGNMTPQMMMELLEKFE